MAFAEAGLERPGFFARFAQEHLRVFFFSLGKLRQTPVAAALTALVIGIALALPAALYVLTRNVETVGYSWRESLQISLFLKDSVSAERGAALAHEIGARQDVAKTQYISRDQSLTDFKAQSGFGDALGILDENPLPAVIAVTPARSVGKAGVQELDAELGRLPEVDIAKLDQKWLERLYALLDIARRAVGMIAVLLGLAVMVVIGNTVRLDIEARRDEIEVMKLIGAPDSFIRRPFLYAGFWHGLFGGILAWLLVTIGVHALSGPAATLAASYGSDFRLSGLPAADGFSLIAAGIVLGWAAAYVTVGRRLALIEPR
ncbi:permease-like cell division protein FtsX [Solimonas marina]|uniref:Cell division protein FtsX n=1 Tax=Solimonas marina TaxID=2714601 RepID=A0A970B631_9GAMM|nr:permease-like cell division protein FtsX [Solimonas marina]NKF22220.1 cell division protein FtsX [Solimonas marina]